MEDNKVARSKAFCKEHDLSEAQCDVLRTASRRWWKCFDEKSGEHDGGVSTYNVRDATLLILRERGFIADTYKIEERDLRLAKDREYGQIIRDAFALAKQEPFSREVGSGVLIWRAVLSDLNRANAIRNSLQDRCLRITASGREMARLWKEVIGAVEE